MTQSHHGFLVPGSDSEEETALVLHKRSISTTVTAGTGPVEVHTIITTFVFDETLTNPSRGRKGALLVS